MIIKNNDMRLIVIGDIKLLPGFNDVNTELYKEYTEKETQGKGKTKVPLYDLSIPLSTRAIEIITEKNKEDEVKEEFKDFSTSLKENIVNNTYSIKTLENWRRDEENIPVKNMIEDRLKDIKNNVISDTNTYGKPEKHT